MTRTVLLLLLICGSNMIQGQCWSTVATGLSHSVGIRTDGTLWSWGLNNYGQLGDGTLINRKIAVQIGSDNNWVMVDAGGHQTIAIKSDGTLWSWGRGNRGLAGNGQNLAASSFPVQVGIATDWASISIEHSHVLALKNDGSLWAWGDNNARKLGLGSNAYYATVPTQVGSDTDWQFAMAGFNNSTALKNNGTIWGWGQESNGTFNTGTLEETFDYEIPTQIDVNSGWVQISCGSYTLLALKENGTLWVCGSNQYGTVGNNGPTTSDDGTPSLIQLNDDIWEYIAVHRGTSRAIRNDGTLWAWGHNSHGQIGDGTVGDKSVPTMVGNNTDWLLALGGQYHTLALTTNHSLYAWGGNHYGQLGDNTLSHKSSPTAIGFPCTLSTDDFVHQKLVIWPNPARDKVVAQVKLPDGDADVNLYNIAGQLIYRGTMSVTDGQGEISVDAYSSGIYFIMLSSEKVTYQGKIIKQ